MMVIKLKLCTRRKLNVCKFSIGNSTKPHNSFSNDRSKVVPLMQFVFFLDRLFLMWRYFYDYSSFLIRLVPRKICAS